MDTCLVRSTSTSTSSSRSPSSTKEFQNIISQSTSSPKKNLSGLTAETIVPRIPTEKCPFGSCVPDDIDWKYVDIASLTVDSSRTIHYDYQFYRCHFQNLPIISRKEIVNPGMFQSIIIRDEDAFSTEGFIAQFYIWPQIPKSPIEPIIYLRSINEATSMKIVLVNGSLLKITFSENDQAVSLRHGSLKLNPERWNKVTIQVTIVEIAVQINCAIIQSIFNEGLTQWKTLTRADVLFDLQIEKQPQSKLSGIKLMSLTKSNNIQRTLCSFENCLEKTKISSTETLNELMTDDFLSQFKVTYVKCNSVFLERMTLKSNADAHKYRPIIVDLSHKKFEDGFQVEFYFRPFEDEKGLIFILKDVDMRIVMKSDKYLSLVIETSHENTALHFKNARIKISKWNKITIRINRVEISATVNCINSQEFDNTVIKDWQKMKQLFFLKDNNDQTFIKGEISGFQVLPFDKSVCFLEKCITEERYSPITSEEVYTQYLSSNYTSILTSKMPKTFPSIERHSTSKASTFPMTTFAAAKINISDSVNNVYPTIDKLLTVRERKYLNLEVFQCTLEPIIVISRNSFAIVDDSRQIILDNTKVTSIDGFIIEFYILLTEKDIPLEDPVTVLELSSNVAADLSMKIRIDRTNRINCIFQQRSHWTKYSFNDFALKEDVWNKVELQISSTELTLIVDCKLTQRRPNTDVYNWQQITQLSFLLDHKLLKSKLALFSLAPIETDNNILHRQLCVVNKCLMEDYSGILEPNIIDAGILSNYSLFIHRPNLRTYFLSCSNRNILVSYLNSGQPLYSVTPIEINNDLEFGIEVSMYLRIYADNSSSGGPLLSLLSLIGEDFLILERENLSTMSVYMKTKYYDLKINFENQPLEKEQWNKIELVVTTNMIGLNVNCRGLVKNTDVGFTNWKALNRMILLTNSLSFQYSKETELADVQFTSWRQELYSCSLDPCLLVTRSTAIYKFKTVFFTKGFPGNIGECGPRGEQGATGHKGDAGIKGNGGIKGDKGETGFRGPPGIPGATGVLVNAVNGVIGSQGMPGIKGVKGISGKKGQDGVMGHNGLLGKEGYKGASGMSGDKGSRGTRGFRGIRGREGVRGDIGKLGNIGEVGIKGPRGSKGKLGEIGERGSTGTSGIAGLRGRKGHRGSTGQPGKDSLITGVKGNTGPRGEDGDKGKSGPKGESGINGTLGEKGEDGHIGKTGNRGLTGNIGYHGLIGQKGKQGMKGVNGNAGTVGAVGLHGPPGDDGDRGLPGLIGVTGSMGKQGSAGKNGESGNPGLVGQQGPRGMSLVGIKGLVGAMGSKGECGVKGNMGGKGESGDKGLPGLLGEKGERGSDGISPKGQPGKIGEKGDIGIQGISGAIGLRGEPGPPGIEGIIGPMGYKVEQGESGDEGDLGEPGPIGEPGNVILSGFTTNLFENVSRSLLNLVNQGTNHTLNFTDVKMDSSKRIVRLYEQVFSHRNQRGYSSEWPSTSCKDVLLQNPSALAMSVWLDSNEGSPDDSFRAECRKKMSILNKGNTHSFFTCISSIHESGDLLTYMKPYDADVTWQSELRLEGLVLSPPELIKGYPHVSQLNFIQMRSKYAEQEVEFLCDESIIYADIIDKEENFRYATAFLTLDDNYVDLSDGFSIGPGYGYMDKKIYMFDDDRSVFNVTILYDECKYKAPGTFTKMLLSTNKPEMLPIVDFRIKYFKSNGKCVLGANIYPVCFQ